MGISNKFKLVWVIEKQREVALSSWTPSAVPEKYQLEGKHPISLLAEEALHSGEVPEQYAENHISNEYQSYPKHFNTLSVVLYSLLDQGHTKSNLVCP